TSIGAADVDVLTTAASVNTNITTQSAADDVDLTTTGASSNLVLSTSGDIDAIDIADTGTGSFVRASGGDQNDGFTITNSGDFSRLEVAGQLGDDTVFVQLGSGRTRLINVVELSGEGNDALTANGTALSDVIDVNDAMADAVTMANETIMYPDALESLLVDGQNGADTFAVRPDVTTVVTVQGRSPSAVPGDILDMNLIGSNGATFTPGPGPRDGQFAFSNRANVVYRNIEELQNVAILEFSAALYAELEGDTPHTRSDVTVVRSGDVTIPVTVDVDMSDNTAFHGQDYLQNDASLSFGSGVTSIPVPFTILGDQVVELDEYLNLALQNAGVSVALGPLATGVQAKIVNDESATITISDVSLLEGDSPDTTTFAFDVTLDHAVDVGVNVVALTNNGTATAGVDYHGLTSFPLIFSGTAAGETETVSVTVIGDLAAEANETFFVQLTNLGAGGRAVSFAKSTGTGTIIDDDTAGLVQHRFDFGTGSSPVASGYTQVTALTAYPSAGGAGWSTGTISQRDRLAPNALDQDFNFTSDGTFQVDLPNGVYDVSLTLGDQLFGHDQQGVFLEGTQVATVTTGAGQFQTVSSVVTVSDGVLHVRIADLGGPDAFAAITQLEIVTHQLAPLVALDFGTATSPVAAGHSRVTAGSLYTPGGMGWQAGSVQGRDRGAPTDGDRDFNFTPDAVFKIDVANGTYQVSVTLGDNAFAHDQQ
ncbi:MAG: hypothetical protein KDA99_29380, partial [Planctomycetales bacterium]|nr:hypothetical protein [Planctomycetales bacterium]